MKQLQTFNYKLTGKRKEKLRKAVNMSLLKVNSTVDDTGTLDNINLS